MSLRIKDLLLPLTFALCTTWIIQYFFINRSHNARTVHHDSSNHPGQSFVVPEEEIKPFNREINFLDKKDTEVASEIEIETSLARYLFSSAGGSLVALSFKRMVNEDVQYISTISREVYKNQKERCFLIALDDKTPYYYTLVNQTEKEETVSLQYNAETDVVAIRKIFTIHKNSHQIDLTIDLEPRAPNIPQEARLFISGPFLPELGSYEVISGVFSDHHGTIKGVPRDSIDFQKGWYQPAFFGVDDRYFIHTLIDDANKSITRAYYQACNTTTLYAIFELKVIAEATATHLSFYFGPKEENAMKAVDSRLEKTLAYSGWLSQIAHFFLRILRALYHYLGNYGWAIVVLTLCIKIIMTPFTWGANEQQKKSAEYKKKLTYIQQKYKNDQTRLAQERAALIKQHGLPGLSGCLPMILQIPIFITLSRVLNSSIELYKVPFLWIKDLSMSDPYYILPLLVCILMIIQSLLLPTNENKIFMLVVAIVFGAMVANFSAGLALYLLVSTFCSVGQIFLQNMFKKMRRAL